MRYINIIFNVKYYMDLDVYVRRYVVYCYDNVSDNVLAHRY